MSAASRRVSVRLPHYLREKLVARAAAECVDLNTLVLRAVKADLLLSQKKKRRAKRASPIKAKPQ